MNALASAKEALKNHEPADAQAHCCSVLEADPANAEAWHLRGISHAQLGDLDEALECFEKATECDPASSLYPYNLALALQRQGELDRAADAYQIAIDRKDNFLEARANLGNVRVAQGKMFQAAACFESLVERFPNSSDAHFNLANTLMEIGRGGDAIKHYKEAIALDPDCTAARENLGRAFTDIGDVREARYAWQAWLDHDPNNELAKHMLAAAMSEDEDADPTAMPARCTDECVRQQFNEDFAGSYDDQLSRLNFRAPELIQTAVDAIEPPIRDADVLDAGCGTGLCGRNLRPLARSLVGVDLAPAMLVEARKRNCYDEVEEAELTEFLEARPTAFDLIVSSDTLCYFGDLTQLMAAAAKALRDNGHLVFSVEKETAAESARGFRLQLHGRYCHTEQYVRTTLAQAGFKVVSLTCEVQRTEMGQPVEGLIVTAVREV